MTAGTFFTVGVGPGDPELITLKAARIVETADVIAFFAKRGRAGHARTVVEGRIDPNAEQLRLEYPYTTEVALNDPDYAAGIERFYDECAGRLAARLDTGKNVALLCEGDPFFYGSSMYLFDRLRGAYRSEVVAGVAGMSGCWAAAGLPIVHGDDVLAILPGTLDEPFLTARLQACDAAVIMKVGRNLAKIRTALRHVGMIERAIYVERGTMHGERIMPLCDFREEQAPYFSMVLVPGRQRVR